MSIKKILAILFFITLSMAQSSATRLHAEGNNVPLLAPSAAGDWPQVGNDPQRSNYTSLQVDPPYCYTWKWYEAPIASRAQPIVASGRLFIGSMDGVMYARNASTGAPLWTFSVGGPIRHSAGVINNLVIFSSYDGYTYALDVATGSQVWKASMGPSATAPLIDSVSARVYIASTNGKLTAHNATNGAQLWLYDSGAPILTTPSLSVDRQTVFVGNEDIQAIAVRASDGVQLWRITLQGQSLADRYPVVITDTVIYRSQPIYFFHLPLQEGDAVMDQAGALNTDWATDWSNVRPQITNYLSAEPSKQTMFVLNTSNGVSRGVAPVLYTYGDGDSPNTPVVRNGIPYVTYRARHGIQVDSPNDVHVSTKYDAELGQMNLSTLDIVGLRQASGQVFNYQFRMTSDEPAMLSIGGNILWVDSWERFGGFDLGTAQLVHVGNVSNDWPECGGPYCGITSTNPFFPLSGNSADPAYPFPSPRVTEGHSRGGAVIANNMIYWRVIEGGIAGISHRSGSNCPAPFVWRQTSLTSSSARTARAPLATVRNFLPFISAQATSTRQLGNYVTLDLTTPVTNPPADLVSRLRAEIQAITLANDHLLPYYLERGFSTSGMFPYNTPNPPGPPVIAYGVHGNAYWHDPGELLYTMALAFPYLDASLQTSVKQYMASEMKRYPPLENLPWDGQLTWLRRGIARENYAVPVRNQLNSWPPPGASMSALYALWLWSKNTGDWSYAQSHWADATALFNARNGSINFYSDIAGVIGYARMASHFGYTSAYNNGSQVAINAMQAGLNFNAMASTATGQYPDADNSAMGWYAPVFYGMTPEIGLYLREQTNSTASNYLVTREQGDSLRWWYLTRVGAHGETNETSYVSPFAAWSHFLAHAYITGDSQSTLRSWLDRPWGRGDLYSIQKIVATIHAR